MRVLSKLLFFVVAVCMLHSMPAGSVWATDQTDDKDTDVTKLEDVTVTAPKSRDVPHIESEKTIIDLDDYEKAAPVYNVVDLLRDSAIVDLRGKSDIDVRSERGESPILLRGFDVRRFANAIDGVTMDQPLHFGQVVDYSTVPLGQIESVEIIPGAHSARYAGKAMGGVINFKTKAPRIREDVKPDITIDTSFGSYETNDYKAVVEGGYGGFNYAASYHNYSTDGYLRHGAAEMENFGWMIGYAVSSGGYLKYMGNYVEKDRESYVTNDPSGDYDPGLSGGVVGYSRRRQYRLRPENAF